MKKRDKLFVLAYFLNILNGIFLLFGLMLLAFGHWIFLDGNKFVTLLCENSLMDSFSNMLLATGSIIVFIGLLGYLGSIRRNKCLVAVYMVLVCLTFVVQVGMLIHFHIGIEMVNKQWKVHMDEAISTYGNKNQPEKEPQWDILNCIQRMGCEEDIEAWYEENIWILFMIHFGLLAVEALQFIVSTWLCGIMKKNMVLPTK